MDFVTKSFRKNETLTSWTLLQHICPHFWAWLPNTIAITPKSEDKYVVKVFNWSEVHLSDKTCYKIFNLRITSELSDKNSKTDNLAEIFEKMPKKLRNNSHTLNMKDANYKKESNHPISLKSKYCETKDCNANYKKESKITIDFSKMDLSKEIRSRNPYQYEK